MAKNGYEQMANFWKNISSDLPEIGPKYHFGTNNYDYKGLVININEKIFRVAKLTFLAPLIRLLG